MELINGISRMPGFERRPLYLALGNFDGVHRGHQAIIRTVVEKARTAEGCSAALIFDPHPSFLLRKDCSFALLNDIDDRAELMAALDLDYCIVEPFTAELSALSPERFVLDILRQRLKVSGVVVGYDYSFGLGGKGSADMMSYWGQELGFSVDICPLVEYSRKIVSSSKIRSLLLAGYVGEAAELLNYYFFRRGKVVKGKGIGKKMVYPTANIAVHPRLIQPGKGVYLTAVSGAGMGNLGFGVTNVGEKPTFSLAQPELETYILDYEGDLYHREICLYFLEKLRDTQAFSSPKILKEQIGLDILKARDLIRAQYYKLRTDAQASCTNRLPLGLTQPLKT